LLLLFHILFAAIWFRTTVIFLILSIKAAATTDQQLLVSSYTTMYELVQTSGRFSIFGTVITGILLSCLQTGACLTITGSSGKRFSHSIRWG
jgi:hypothetical protein